MLHIQFVVKLNGSSLSTQYVPLQRKFKLLALLAVCSFSQILALVGHCKIYLSGKVKLKYYFIRKLFCWLLARDTEVSTTGPPDYRAASFLRQSDAWTHPQHSIIKARQSSHCFNKFYLVYLILTKSKKNNMLWFYRDVMYFLTEQHSCFLLLPPSGIDLFIQSFAYSLKQT